MDGGSASIPSDRSLPLPSPSPPSSLTDQIRLMLSYVEDRNAKISFLKTLLRKKQEGFIPPEVPRDLILEAKIRIGDEKKASANRAAAIQSLVCSPSDEDRRTQILQVENNIGRLLSDDELAEIFESPKGADGESPSNATGPSSSSDPEKLQGSKTSDTWSSLFQTSIHRSRDLQRHSQPSTDPEHDIVFDEEDSSAAVQN